MIFYILLALILVPFYLLELVHVSRVKAVGLSVLLAVIFFGVVAGLRDDTGYDWFVYKNIYKGVSESGTLLAAIDFGKDNGSELGFSIVLYFLSALGFSFWGVQLIIGIFNCYAFVRLNNFLAKGAITGLLVYYCWLFLVLQMGVLRMSVALAFLSLALISLLKENSKKFYFLVLFAAFFHTFAIIIGFAMWLAKKPLPKSLMLILMIALSLLYLAGFDFAGGVVRAVSGTTPSFVSAKLDIYLALGETYQRGAGELLYKVLIVGLLCFLSFKVDSDKVDKILLNLGFLYVTALLLFWKYPVFHDRIKYFALMPIFYLFFSVLSKMNAGNRLVYGVGFLLVSFMILIHEVTGSLFYPYTPYYNMCERWLGGQDNDGEERTLRYYKEFDAQWLGGSQ